MTREIAKALTGILAQKLLEYEKQFGEIRLAAGQVSELTEPVLIEESDHSNSADTSEPSVKPRRSIIVD